MKNKYLLLKLSTLLVTFSASGQSIPKSPSGLHATFINPTMINLSWIDNSTNETHFTIEQYLKSDQTKVQNIYSLDSNTTQFVIKGLEPNTSYYYKIKSSNKEGSSEFSTLFFVSTSSSDDFPLILKNGRLVNKSNNFPFLIIGDSPWSLMVGPDRDGIIKYLDNRKEKGVNALIINLIEKYFNPHPDAKDAYGNAPFLVPNDFSTPNPAYFENVDFILGKAREYGMLVFLFPAYLGYDYNDHEQGWYSEINDNSLSNMNFFGRYIGERYKEYDNIIWMMGGDNAPDQVLDKIHQMVLGIKETAGNDPLFSVHNSRGESGVTQYPEQYWKTGNSEQWIDINTTYSDCDNTPRKLIEDYYRNLPFYYIEGNYENEGSNPICLRSQMYWSVLMGSNGTFYGNHPLYMFYPGWDDKSVLDAKGSYDLKRSGEFFKSRAWFNLIPDTDHSLLTYGFGDINSEAYAAAALMKDSSTAIIYTPENRDLTVNLTKISGDRTHVWWYQPSSGHTENYILNEDSDSHTFSPPSSDDWLLVLDDARLGLKEPGSIGAFITPQDSIPENFIYPNPAYDKLYIKYADFSNPIIIIYNLQGKEILREQPDANAIDISGLPKGIYLVKIVGNYVTRVNRLIKE